MAYARVSHYDDLSVKSEPEDSSSSAPMSKLEQQAVQVRHAQTSWQSYFQGKVITEEVFRFISDYDKADVERRTQLVATHGVQAVKALLQILQSISKEQVLQYVLVLIDDLIQNDPTSIRFFHQYAEQSGMPVYSSFIKLMNRPDHFIVQMSSRLVSFLVLHSRHLMSAEDQRWYLHWVVQQLTTPNNVYVTCVASALQRLMRVEAYRLGYMRVHGIKPLLDVLASRNTGFQMQYQLIFCLWLMAYSSTVATAVIELNAIPVLADALKGSGKEKVTRIILAALRNLLEKPADKQVVHVAATAMISCKVPTVIAVLANKQWQDEDIRDDVESLQEKLEEYLLDLSSFDEYLSEVRSGRLQWTPVHKSDKFWRENAQRLNEKNHEVLKILTQLLQESQDSTVLQVAAHDFGEYVRHYPRGKKVLDSLGGKQLIMGLMNHADGQVRYEALVAVQKMMVQNWEFLGRQLKTD
ncbi:V-type proton ATPase subunit H-like [Sycon ciliatum]|uniref:V-type proton ATPase subunit H-like n=1 Tax=Sycon ciliatum TaxID=27933 RepID=UPI0020AD5E55|eukprot:scpid69905/ scgid35364/ V-type proton ATPase subunit H; Vacuolar proton pump subunit H; Vacuolar proton pump subunit SFD